MPSRVQAHRRPDERARHRRHAFLDLETAEWGDVSVGPKIIDASVKKRMVKQFKEIEIGKFTKEWIAEYEGGYKRFNALRKEGEQHQIEKVGEKLRSTMSLIKQSKIKKGASQASLISSSN